jgi:flagellar basal-body rod protein FlgB
LASFLLDLVKKEPEMFLSKLGNKNFTLVTKLLDLQAKSQKVIAQNIANVNTPNYKRREFRFEKALHQALGTGEASSYRDVTGWVARPNNTAVRNNGNNVDVEAEMMSMKETEMLYEIYTQVYNKKSTLVKKAINGGS